MSSIPEDNFLSFDLSLLDYSSNSMTLENKLKRYSRTLHILKKKIVSTSFAVDNIIKYKQDLEELEKKLSAALEENKHICIDYNNSLDRIRKLDKEVEFSHRRIKEFQEKLETSENQCKAIQSHANQLQQLVQEFETQIESLKIENQLAKVNTKEQTKRTQSQKNEYDTLIKDICLVRDVVLGKKKLRSHHKIILKKYDKFKSNTDDSASECSIDDIEDVFNDSTPPLCYSQVHQLLVGSELEKNIHNDDLSIKTIDAVHDSDSNNEVVSEDTGRGSSLACSDTEKCYNSPDYFITNSPFSNAMMKDKKNYTDMSTSPLTVQIERSDACTSPLLFSNKIIGFNNVMKIQKQTRDIGIMVHLNDFIAHRNVATSPIKMKVHERASSPIKIKVHERASSPIKLKVHERASSPLKILQVDKAISPMEKNALKRVASPVHKNHKKKATCPNRHGQYEKRATTEFEEIYPKTQMSVNEESVEINNSGVNDNQDTDCEVENILRSVRLDYKVITPIPKSPAKVQKNDTQSCRNCTCICMQKMEVIEAIIKDYFIAQTKFVGDDKITTNNCNDKDVIINIHEKDLAKENCKTIESPLKNSSTTSNFVSSPKPPDLAKKKCKTIASPLKNSSMTSNFVSSPKSHVLEVSSEIVKARNEDQIHNNNKSKDKINTKDLTMKLPIQEMDKTKKTKKLTRLERLRKKLVPKCKISRDLTPPNRKISRRNPLLFKKSIPEQSAVPEKNNKTAYENAVKVMAELKANEKNKPINTAPCNAAVNNNNNTKEIQIVITKCDGLIKQNKNINTVQLDNKPNPFVKSTVIPTTVDNVSNVQDNSTKTYINKTPTDIENSPSQPVLRRSKRLSSSASNNSDISNKIIIEKEIDSTMNKIKSRKRKKRVASGEVQDAPKKLLRISDSSHSTNKIKNTKKSVNISQNNIVSKPIEYRRRSARLSTSQRNELQTNKDLTSPNTVNVVSYKDLDIFSKQKPKEYKDVPTCKEDQKHTSEELSGYRNSILCRMLKKYAKPTITWNLKKLPETIINSMCKKIENGIAHLNSVSTNNLNESLNKFVKDISNCNVIYFLAGLIKYLKDPMRRHEMNNKASILNSPFMTKSERVLIYILKRLQFTWPHMDFIEVVLSKIEYVMFQLNNTPEFGIVESMSHFYAVLCRYFGKITRLRMFIIDAMYCVQFKSVPIIKQCLDVWMHILPLAHMGIAKSSIVSCLVYLLHFFKSEDKFNRVQEIRRILSRKYSYNASEWTESSILEKLHNAITELSDDLLENKMLRMCLIIIAKRKGPKWCQKHIVHNMLLKFIHRYEVPEKIKEFCISMLGPLLKPYPNYMKSDTGMVFQKLEDMLAHDVSPTKKEAILSSLIYMSRYKPDRVIKALAAWKPVNISDEFENNMANYIRERSEKVWEMKIQSLDFT